MMFSSKAESFDGLLFSELKKDFDLEFSSFFSSTEEEANEKVEKLTHPIQDDDYYWRV